MPQNKHDTLLRQWTMLHLVPRHPAKVDTASLKRQLSVAGFETTQRTIQRDLINLSTCFSLVSDETNTPYGWSWAKNAKVLDIPGIEPVTALCFRLIEMHLQTILPGSILDTIQPYFRQAHHVLESLKSDGYAQWPGKVRVIERGMSLIPPDIDNNVQSIIYQALMKNKQCRIHYHSRMKRKEEVFTVHPLALVVRDSVVYLVATIDDYQDPRQLALHRMSQADLLDAEAKRPNGFDIDDYIAQGEFSYPVSNKTVRLVAAFDEITSRHFYETPVDPSQMLGNMQDGRIRLEVNVTDTAALRWWLLGFGDRVEVINPKELRDEIGSMIARMHEKYQ